MALPLPLYVKTTSWRAEGGSFTRNSFVEAASGSASVYSHQSSRFVTSSVFSQGSVGSMHAVSVCIPAESPAAWILSTAFFRSALPPGNALRFTS